MKLVIYRHRIGSVACDGMLKIDGWKICDTAENVKVMPPVGTYRIVLYRNKRLLRIVPYLIAEGMTIPEKKGMTLNAPYLCLANGIYHRNDGRIVLGTYIAPGCVKCSRKVYKPLYDRINNTLRRGKMVTLEIRE